MISMSAMMSGVKMKKDVLTGLPLCAGCYAKTQNCSECGKTNLEKSFPQPFIEKTDKLACESCFMSFVKKKKNEFLSEKNKMVPPDLSSEKDELDSLPPEVFGELMSFLTFRDYFGSIVLVCKKWCHFFYTTDYAWLTHLFIDNPNSRLEEIWMSQHCSVCDTGEVSDMLFNIQRHLCRTKNFTGFKNLHSFDFGQAKVSFEIFALFLSLIPDTNNALSQIDCDSYDQYSRSTDINNLTPLFFKKVHRPPTSASITFSHSIEPSLPRKPDSLHTLTCTYHESPIRTTDARNRAPTDFTRLCPSLLSLTVNAHSSSPVSFTPPAPLTHLTLGNRNGITTIGSVTVTSVAGSRISIFALLNTLPALRVFRVLGMANLLLDLEKQKKEERHDRLERLEARYGLECRVKKGVKVTDVLTALKVLVVKTIKGEEKEGTFRTWMENCSDLESVRVQDYVNKVPGEKKDPLKSINRMKRFSARFNGGQSKLVTEFLVGSEMEKSVEMLELMYKEPLDVFCGFDMKTQKQFRNLRELRLNVQFNTDMMSSRWKEVVNGFNFLVESGCNIELFYLRFTRSMGEWKHWSCMMESIVFDKVLKSDSLREISVVNFEARWGDKKREQEKRKKQLEAMNEEMRLMMERSGMKRMEKEDDCDYEGVGKRWRERMGETGVRRIEMGRIGKEEKEWLFSSNGGEKCKSVRVVMFQEIIEEPSYQTKQKAWRKSK